MVEGGVSEYEKQRLLRIRENRARLEALGLPKLASSFSGSVEKQTKRKGKGKKNEDDEYQPSDGDGICSSSEDDFEEENDDDEEEDGKVGEEISSDSPVPSTHKGKNRSSLKKGKAKKKVPVQKHECESNYIDDDAALLKAIALSLEGSPEVSGVVHSGPSQNSGKDVDADLNERKGGGQSLEDAGKRKRRKMHTSRVQMTEDEVIVHFFQFDEAGKGNITVRDLQRVAITHDFTWTDKEMMDMIRSFDSDGDGRLSLDDFRKIAYRCNMIQRCENAVMDLKS